MKYIFLVLKFHVLFLLLSCSFLPPKSESNPKIKILKFTDTPKIGTTRAGQDIFLGGFSSLAFIKKADNKIFLRAVTDRGPNPEAFSFLGGVGRNIRPILLPDFAPSLVEISVDLTTDKIAIEKIRPFMHSTTEKITGLPPLNPKGKLHPKNQKYEIATDIFGTPLKPQSTGMDSEGLCAYKNTFLVSEEYVPALLQFDSDLIELKRWTPGHGLPKELSSRKINRGLEGLACDENYAYLMMQSPLKSHLEKDADQIRIIQFNPRTNKTLNEFFYPTESGGADKIGDMAIIHDKKFLVIEQNGKLGSEEGIRKIYQIDLAEADHDGRLTKKLILDLNQLGFDFEEKIEGIAIIDQNTLALVSDNDFGIESQVDLATGKFQTKKNAFSYLAIIHLEQALK